MQSIRIRWTDIIIIKIYRPITVALIMCIPTAIVMDQPPALVWRTECAKPTMKISRTLKLESPHFHTQKSGILTIYII